MTLEKKAAEINKLKPGHVVVLDTSVLAMEHGPNASDRLIAMVHPEIKHDISGLGFVLRFVRRKEL